MGETVTEDETAADVEREDATEPTPLTDDAAGAARSFSLRHLLGLEGVGADDLLTMLRTTESFREILDRPIKKVPALRGQTVVNLFYEASTRTRISFELAEKRLSADLVNFSASGSSVKKGESLRDTVRNILAMKTEVVVIRHPSSGAPGFLARETDATIINAGDGTHEHPTQGLLDIYTLWERWRGFTGKRVLIVGDIAHSRVARSNIWGLKTLGAEVAICGPATLLPMDIEGMGVEVFTDFDAALESKPDAINMLRVQRERQDQAFLPSLREYTRFFGLGEERAARLPDDVIIMHPGPINRGIELTPDIADGPRSVILEQVTNGVAARMAVLFLLCQAPSGGGTAT